MMYKMQLKLIVATIFLLNFSLSYKKGITKLFNFIHWNVGKWSYLFMLMILIQFRNFLLLHDFYMEVHHSFLNS